MIYAYAHDIRCANDDGKGEYHIIQTCKRLYIMPGHARHIMLPKAAYHFWNHLAKLQFAPQTQQPLFLTKTIFKTVKYIASVGINGAGAPCYNVLAKLQLVRIHQVGKLS